MSDEVSFYEMATNYSAAELPSDRKPEPFYERLAAMTAPSVDRVRLDAERTWYACLQPEYKAWPAAVAALAATKISVPCEELRVPFPAFAVRLPAGFVQEPGGPAIESLLVTLLRNSPAGIGSWSTTSMDGGLTACSRRFASRWRNLGRDVPAILSLSMGYHEGAPSAESFRFSVVSIGLERGVTIDEEFQRIEWDSRKRGTDFEWRAKYAPSEKLVREMLSLAVGTALMATGKCKKPLVARDQRPRQERRRFEREHGEEQPTFHMGRDLVLPREEGAAPLPAGGEGSGRHLKWSHFRTGYMRNQPYWKGSTRDKPTHHELIFIPPVIVGANKGLPLRPRTTPSSILEPPPS